MNLKIYLTNQRESYNAEVVITIQIMNTNRIGPREFGT